MKKPSKKTANAMIQVDLSTFLNKSKFSALGMGGGGRGGWYVISEG
jgi:hypothetical protein